MRVLCGTSLYDAFARKTVSQLWSIRQLNWTAWHFQSMIQWIPIAFDSDHFAAWPLGMVQLDILFC